ncbi:hypothetical protein GCM10008986_09370 [Salinibacillus aidingensis]|uniref:Transposase n=1 Tax=Salinibacillus aidingensis TaxID=237684 RepID=A0ABP3KW22_9BACI
MIVTPYLSVNVITHWRKLFDDYNKKKTTIAYDIGNKKGGRRSGVEGQVKG